MIKFGTDGWRAIMADDFTFGNVEILVQAIANYLKNTAQTKRGIVIGYDQRFLSDHFAYRAAEILSGNGLRVFLANKALPTPVTAFAITHGNHDGALMFTASHNPPEYNGLKFIPFYAGPALPDITNGIEAEVKNVYTTGQIVKITLKEGEKRGLILYFDPSNAYIEHLNSILDLSVFKQSKLKILLNPMFGAGIGYLPRILADAGCEIREINNYRDPLFGGMLPEPTGEVLKCFAGEVKTGSYDLGLALDGDADRFGIIDSDGAYISPNQVLPLLLHHFYTRGHRGPVARTVATTHLLDSIAKKFGEKSLETPVGFKYIGSAIKDQGALLGGEESGGLSIKGHIPEKDGILACCLMAELMASRAMTLKALLHELCEIYGNFHSERLDHHYNPAEREILLKRIIELNPESVAGRRVKGRITIDGTKLALEDGSWCLMRPSGTEPLVRIYVETQNPEDLQAIQIDLKSKLAL